MESFASLQWEILGDVHDDNFGSWELAPSREHAEHVRAAIQSDENWRTPLERRGERMFTAYITPEGQRAAERFADRSA